MNTPKTLHLKPGRPGLVVRDPISKLKLAPDGGRVPNNQYWQRRIIAGDAVFVDESANRVDAQPRETITSSVKATTSKAKD